MRNISPDILRRVVVIGASGQLGSDIVKALYGIETVGVDHAMVDIESPASISSALAHHRPSLVINTAAFHNVERCETHAERAFSVNTVAVESLASICDAAGIALAHISTDYVFDGAASSPYDEKAAAHPMNIYGASKYAGELTLSIKTKRFFIFRTSGLYGLRGSSTKGYTFVERMLEQARSGRPLRVVDDIVHAPSYTVQVAGGIRRILEGGQFGIYHVTNAGETTWYDFAVEILKMSGVAASVERTTSDAFPSYARRPRYSVLANAAMEKAKIEPLPDWQEGLRAYLHERRSASASP